MRPTVAKGADWKVGYVGPTGATGPTGPGPLTGPTGPNGYPSWDHIVVYAQAWLDTHFPRERPRLVAIDLMGKPGDPMDVTTMGDPTKMYVPGPVEYSITDQFGNSHHLPSRDFDMIIEKARGREGDRWMDIRVMNTTTCIWCGGEFPHGEVDAHEEVCGG